MKLLRRAAVLIVLAVLAGGTIYFAHSLKKKDTVSTVSPHTETVSASLPKVAKKPVKKTTEHLPNLGVRSKSVILMNAQTGGILYNKNIDEPLPTASMSKMMTELLVLEAIHDHKLTWDKRVTISDYVYAISNHPGFAEVHLKKGTSYTIRELFDAMAIHSANGAAIALSEAVAGSEKNFVTQMNAKAKKLGLTHSHFVDSTGLNNTDLGSFASVGAPTDTNVMSAKDVALLAKQLISEHPEFLDIIKQPKYTFRNHTYTNSNWMLPEINKQDVGFDGVDGLKTGYTDEAGYCFAGTVKRNDKRLISVVMGASTKVTRFSETERLYKAAFNQK